MGAYRLLWLFDYSINNQYPIITLIPNIFQDIYYLYIVQNNIIVNTQAFSEHLQFFRVLLDNIAIVQTLD